MKKAKLKKLLSAVLNVLLCIFLAVCIISVVFTVVSRRDADGAAEFFGYQLRIVTSDSMAECEYTDTSDFEIKDIPVRSMVFVRVMPEDDGEAEKWYGDLKVGDVLTFRYVYTTQVTVTHRITSITEKETGGFVIELAGDNKSSAEGQLYQTVDTSVSNSPNYIIGKVTGQSRLLGAVTSFLTSAFGTVVAIILPCLVIILLEVIKIVNTLNADKKSKNLNETEQKDTELEELRRRLAELEEEKRASETSENADPGSDGREEKTE